MQVRKTNYTVNATPTFQVLTEDEIEAIYFSALTVLYETGVRVYDKETGDPLVGVNVIIEGTTMGAATGIKGEYFIVNVPVGTYVVKASMIGYTPMKFENVRVSIDLTTRIDFQLSSTILDMGEAVVVTAERPLIQVDATSSHAYVTAEEMEGMPVDQFQEVLAIQAGVVTDASGNLHIRGGT